MSFSGRVTVAILRSAIQGLKARTVQVSGGGRAHEFMSTGRHDPGAGSSKMRFVGLIHGAR
jgi:hypothetical protein